MKKILLSRRREADGMTDSALQKFEIFARLVLSIRQRHVVENTTLYVSLVDNPLRILFAQTMPTHPAIISAAARPQKMPSMPKTAPPTKEKGMSRPRIRMDVDAG